MSLTVGTGPFGHRPTGRFDFEPPREITFVEVHRPRVRGIRWQALLVERDHGLVAGQHVAASRPLLDLAELAAELATQKAITAELHALQSSMAETERRMQDQYAQLVRQSAETSKVRDELEAERRRQGRVYRPPRQSRSLQDQRQPPKQNGEDAS